MKATLCFKVVVETSELLFLYLLLPSAGVLFLLFLVVVVVVLAAGALFFHFRLPSARHHKLPLELQGCVQC